LTFQFDGDWNFVVVGGGYYLDQNIKWCLGGSDHGWEVPMVVGRHRFWVDLVVCGWIWWFIR